MCFTDTTASQKTRNTIVWSNVLFPVCRLVFSENLTAHCDESPAVVAKQGNSGSETRDWVYLLSGSWQWDNLWKDVFFTTPSVCQVWGGKVGYGEVEGETWVNCNVYFSLFEGQGRPSVWGLRPVSYHWPRLWHERRRQSKKGQQSWKEAVLWCKNSL